MALVDRAVEEGLERLEQLGADALVAERRREVGERGLVDGEAGDTSVRCRPVSTARPIAGTSASMAPTQGTRRSENSSAWMPSVRTRAKACRTPSSIPYMPVSRARSYRAALPGSVPVHRVPPKAARVARWVAYAPSSPL
ncbi:hypothetical protein RB196_05840 [Streptomyces sp. PmtA]